MTRRALIIANGQFNDGRIGALASPVSDAARLSKLLQQKNVGAYDVTVCNDFSASDYRLAIQDFFDAASPDDMHFVLISGHGIKDRWGKLHFAALDTNFDKLNATGVEARFLVERMDDSAASQQILFLDTCYSGAFQKGLIGKGVAFGIGQDDFGGEATTGKAIVTAATGIQLAGEAEAAGTVQSVFTRHLIEGIATGHADRDETGRITLSELYQYVRAGLKRDAPGQTPQPYYYGLDGSVVIALNPQAKASRLPDKLQQQIASKDRLQRASAIEDLLKISAGASARAGLARQTLQGLQTDDSLLVRNLAIEAIKKLDPATANPAETTVNAPVDQLHLDPAPADREIVAELHSPPARDAPSPVAAEPPPIGAALSELDGRPSKSTGSANLSRNLIWAVTGVLVFAVATALLLRQLATVARVQASRSETVAVPASSATTPPLAVLGGPPSSPATYPSPTTTTASTNAATPRPPDEQHGSDDTTRLKAATRALVGSYWNMWSSDNASVRAELPKYYASSVRYYGKIIPKEQVLSEKSTFISTWKDRVYSPRDVVVSCSGQRCSATFLVDWKAVKDHTIARSGVAEMKFTVSGGQEITEETSRKAQ